MNPCKAECAGCSEVRPDELLSDAERLKRFGDKAGKHGPLSAVKKPFLVRIPSVNATAWHTLARRLGSRPATLMAELLVVASNVPPESWHASVAALQRGSRKVPLVEVGERGWGDAA